MELELKVQGMDGQRRRLEKENRALQREVVLLMGQLEADGPRGQLPAGSDPAASPPGPNAEGSALEPDWAPEREADSVRLAEMERDKAVAEVEEMVRQLAEALAEGGGQPAVRAQVERSVTNLKVPLDSLPSNPGGGGTTPTKR